MTTSNYSFVYLTYHTLLGKYLQYNSPWLFDYKIKVFADLGTNEVLTNCQFTNKPYKNCELIDNELNSYEDIELNIHQINSLIYDEDSIYLGSEESDRVFVMPAKKKYTKKIRITRIEKGKANFVDSGNIDDDV